MESASSDNKKIFLKKPKLLYIGSYKPKAGWMNSVHSHDFCEIMFLKEGSGRFKAEEKEYPVTKGDLIVCNRGVNHCEYIDDTEPRQTVFLGVSRIKINGYPEDCLLKDSFVKIAATGVFYDQLCQYFEQLLLEKEVKSPYFGIISESLLLIIVTYVLRLTSDGADKYFESKKTYVEVKEFLDNNFTTIDTIDNVCRSLYINKFYLTHLFKDTLGIPPLKYLIQKRVSLAKKLLVNTDKPINDIAKACGYLDIAYFCRVFKKVENMTPLDYRKKMSVSARYDKDEK